MLNLEINYTLKQKHQDYHIDNRSIQFAFEGDPTYSPGNRSSSIDFRRAKNIKIKSTNLRSSTGSCYPTKLLDKVLYSFTKVNPIGEIQMFNFRSSKADEKNWGTYTKETKADKENATIKIIEFKKNTEERLEKITI